MNLMNHSELGGFFTHLEDSLLVPGKIAKNLGIDVNISLNGEQLFSFDGKICVLTVGNRDLNEIVYKSGVLGIDAEFIPSSTLRVIKGTINLSGGERLLLSSTDENFALWFSKLCSLFEEKIYLIPDTNFVRRNYYSNFFREILTNMHREVLFGIPRLVILETEANFNLNKETRGGPPSYANPLKKLKFENEREKRGIKRRISFQTMQEIILMRKDGAHILPKLDATLYHSFLPIAGEGHADILIRQEIGNFIEYLRKSDPKTQIIFIASDVMNSMAASAEDINTLLLYSLIEERIKVGYSCLARVIINTAIQLGNCDCFVKYGNKEGILNCTGMWTGKTVDQWQNGKIRIEKSGFT